jgi:uncharacterized protein YndB with AHSA1/START domain
MSRTDSASRLVQADAERVFAALVDADALAEWLPPNGMTGRFERFDARPGGCYRLVLTYDDGSAGAGKSTPETDIVDVRFLDMVPGVRVAQAVDFVSDDPAFAGTMTMIWELSAQDDRTQVTIRAEDVPSGIKAEDHEAGLTSSLAQLATFLDAQDDCR